MGVETEELVLKSNVAAVAARDADALAKLLAASDKVNASAQSGSRDARGRFTGSKTATDELSKQAALGAKIASTDASRAKSNDDLAKTVKKFSDGAASKAPDAPAKIGEAAKSDGASKQAVVANAKAVTAELSKQDALSAKIAAFDATRAKTAADLSKQLKKLNDDATGKTIENDAKAAKIKAAAAKREAEKEEAINGKFRDGAKAGAVALAGLAISGLVILAKGTLKFVEIAIEQAAFREASTRALDRLTKGSGAATYDMAVNAAVKFGVDKETTIAQTKALLQAGLAKETIPLALKAIADVSIDLGDEKGNALKEQLGKIARKSKFDTASVDGLAEAGVKAADVFEALKKKGESTTAVMARLKTNQVTAAEGIQAVLAAVEKSSGGAADATKSIPGLLNAISIRFMGLFDKIDTGPLKEVLKSVLELFEGAKGDALKKEVTDLGNAIFNLLRPLSTAEGKKAMSDAFEKAATTAHDLAIVVGALERGIDKVGKSGGFTLLAVAAEQLLQPLQIAADLIKLINGPDSGKGAGAPPVAASFDTSAANDNGASDVGANMARGTAKGIDDNAGSIGDSMVNAVNAAVKRAESILGIASPAKRLVQTGKWSALGMAKGWNDNSGAVADAASGTASMAAASAGGAAGMGGAGGQGGASGAMPSISITVMVQGGKGGEADAKAIAVALEPEVRQMVRRIQRDAAEQGGSLASRVA